jgi:hypothetical protein
MYTNWDIPLYVNDFNYVMGGETYRYVPDIYIESNNQKYLYEIKSR